MRLLDGIAQLFRKISSPLWVNGPTMLAIRNGFLLCLPLVVAGSLAVLINNLPVQIYQTQMDLWFGDNWRDFGAKVWQASFGILSLPMLFGISHYLVTVRNHNHPLSPISPVIGAIIALASLVVLMPTVNGDWLPTAWTGATGLFVSIFVALVSTRIFLYLSSIKQLQLSLYAEGSDLAIPQAFAAMIPGILTVFIFAIFRMMIQQLLGQTLHETVNDLVLFPFEHFRNSVGTSAAYVFVSQLFWFFGIHGTNVLGPITEAFYTQVMQDNLAALAVGLPPASIISKPTLDTFVFIGGSGSTFSLLLALLVTSRNSGTRRLAQISFLPAVFNINEILLFGLPVILNPIFLFPFLVVPLILLLNSYLAIRFGLVPVTTVEIAWTSPPLISGYVATGGSIAGTILQCTNILIGALIYLPFVHIADKNKEERQKVAMKGLMDVACSNAVSLSGKKCLDRVDEIGMLARSLANELRKAIKTGEGLFLEYQPQVDYLQRKVIGAEALVRWRHHIYGLIPAPIMVAIAEDGGFIKDMGIWVLREAFVERKRWQESGIDDNFNLSVNVSILQLGNTELPKKIVEFLEQFQLDPKAIGIEVTESVALDPDADHNQILHEINRLGIGISIDDFGMGHSSLLYLKHFPVTTLKIDKVLSKDVASNNTSAEIIATVVELCKALNISVVAEFVENQEQIDALCNLNCYIFQGYFFSKPLSGYHLFEYAQKMNKIFSATKSLNLT